MTNLSYLISPFISQWLKELTLFEEVFFDDNTTLSEFSIDLDDRVFFFEKNDRYFVNHEIINGEESKKIYGKSIMDLSEQEFSDPRLRTLVSIEYSGEKLLLREDIINKTFLRYGVDITDIIEKPVSSICFYIIKNAPIMFHSQIEKSLKV